MARLKIRLSDAEVESLRERLKNAGLTIVEIHRRHKPWMHINSIRNKINGVFAMSEKQYKKIIRIIEDAEESQKQLKKSI